MIGRNTDWIYMPFRFTFQKSNNQIREFNESVKLIKITQCKANQKKLYILNYFINIKLNLFQNHGLLNCLSNKKYNTEKSILLNKVI